MARLVNAETVAAVLAAEVAVVLEAEVVEPVAAAAALVAVAPLAAAKAAYKDAELELPTLLIDIIRPRSEPMNEVYRHHGAEL